MNNFINMFHISVFLLPIIQSLCICHRKYLKLKKKKNHCMHFVSKACFTLDSKVEHRSNLCTWRLISCLLCTVFRIIHKFVYQSLPPCFVKRLWNFTTILRSKFCQSREIGELKLFIWLCKEQPKDVKCVDNLRPPQGSKKKKHFFLCFKRFKVLECVISLFVCFFL